MPNSFQLSSFDAIFDCIKTTMKPNLSLAQGERSLFVYLAVSLHKIYEHYNIVQFSCLGLQNIEQSFKMAQHVNTKNIHIPLWIATNRLSESSVTPNIKEFSFLNTNTEQQGCFTLAWTPQGSAIICVRRSIQSSPDQLVNEEAPFDFCWSFDQRLIELIIDNLANLIALQKPELVEEFQMNRAFVQKARIYANQQEKLQEELQNLEYQLEEIFTHADDTLPTAEIAPLMVAKMLTHDLRSQTQNLVMALDMIATSHFDQQQKDSFLQAARQSANQLLGLVEELYNVTSDQKESFPITWEEHQLQDIVQNLINTLLPTLLYSEISIISTLPESLPAIWGDRLLSMRILQNVFFNAMRFTPPQGEIRIELAAPISAHQIAIAITNSGSQISNAAIEQIEERIKDPQATIKARSGIGLVFCKQAMQAMHGHFQIEAYGPNGTRVTLSFLTHKPTF